MVYHGFRANEEIDNILKQVPKREQSKFIKDAILDKHKSQLNTPAAEEKPAAATERPLVNGIPIGRVRR